VENPGTVPEGVIVPVAEVAPDAVKVLPCHEKYIRAVRKLYRSTPVGDIAGMD